jgi:hypothetical protein
VNTCRLCGPHRVSSPSTSFTSASARTSCRSPGIANAVGALDDASDRRRRGRRTSVTKAWDGAGRREDAEKRRARARFRQVGAPELLRAPGSSRCRFLPVLRRSRERRPALLGRSPTRRASRCSRAAMPRGDASDPVNTPAALTRTDGPIRREAGPTRALEGRHARSTSRFVRWDRSAHKRAVGAIALASIVIKRSGGAVALPPSRMPHDRGRKRSSTSRGTAPRDLGSRKPRRLPSQTTDTHARRVPGGPSASVGKGGGAPKAPPIPPRSRMLTETLVVLKPDVRCHRRAARRRMDRAASRSGVANAWNDAGARPGGHAGRPAYSTPGRGN